MNFFRRFPRFFFSLLILTAFGGGFLLSLFSENLTSPDSRFTAYTEEIFSREISGDSLSLHYSLAEPEACGIKPEAPSLGSIRPAGEAFGATLENYLDGLLAFDYSRLSPENKITFDTLYLYFHTRKEEVRYPYMEEILSPGLGISAQLPILLAEYPFYDTGDVEDYLALLSDMKRYFREIASYEEERAALGLFMAERSLDEVLEQCREFTKDSDSHYLLTTFEERLASLSLSGEEASSYIDRNRAAFINSVLPAYRLLIEKLEALRPSCNEPKGLCHFPKGRDYYCYLLKNDTGSYDSPEEICRQLLARLSSDYEELSALLKKDPSLAAQNLEALTFMDSPQKVLSGLSKDIQKDFPALGDVSYQVKTVPASLQSFMSPAFYLTPPTDTLQPNTIYINPADYSSDLDLFSTLAHEGFPGHLYQTQYFGRTEPSSVRYLPNFGGYVEGWATYIESFAAGYAPVDQNISRFFWLNRSVNLCLYSLADLGVHYYGWSVKELQRFLSGFGITSSYLAEEIYFAVLESPVNYLRYYLGCLNFMELRRKFSEIQGEEFSLKEFHRQILTIGPTQFPVLEKHMRLPVQNTSGK